MSDATTPSVPVPARGWTPELKTQFLDRLAAHGNARAACRAVNLSAEAAYRLRRRDPLFARGWAAALLLARENGHQVLGERAIEGVEEQIFYRGELVGTRRRYDSRLLLAHLARLDRLADEESAGGDAAYFDELLACIGNPQGADAPQSREVVAQQAADAASESLRRESMDSYLSADLDAEAGECEPDAYYHEFIAALAEDCQIAARQAYDAAAAEWDQRRGETFDAVDSLCGLGGAGEAVSPPDRSPLPQPLPPALAEAMANNGHNGPSRPAQGEQALFPWTLSTVSTCALSRRLAEAMPSGRASTPRSPFRAPRQALGAG